jgi:L-ascorbate metabolism protein UlaG (beta-lactamase superfamily)
MPRSAFASLLRPGSARARNRALRRLLGCAFGLLGAGCCDLAAPTYIGAVSDHFDMRRFHNPSGPGPKSMLELLQWKLTSDAPGWEEFKDAPPGPPPTKGVAVGELRVTFVNHATMLVQMDELNILTDPIWSERASPVPWLGLGPKRVRPPGIRFEDLPRIDAVLISHNHYDHFDLPTLERLANKHHPRFIVPLGNRELLAERQIPRVEELDWWQSAKLSENLRVAAVPAQHSSQRGVCDCDATLWSGFVLSGAQGAVYFAGDTGAGPHFEQIRARFGPLRMALLPIGGFEPRSYLKASNLDPQEALEAHRVLRPEVSVAMHFGTFGLADDGQREAPELLQAAITKANDPDLRFWVLGFGEGRDVPALPASVAEREAPEPAAEPAAP